MNIIVKATPEKLVLPEIIAFSYGAFMPLLSKNEEKNRVIKKTFRFGPLDRNYMDVYYPPGLSETKKIPVLFFLYGGYFIMGDRTLAAWPLIYGNIGSFFTSKGFLTIIPDYRLVPHVTYPGPAEDLVDALGWLAENTESVEADTKLSIDLEHIFLMGHSAGGAHIATIFLDEGVRQHLSQKFPYPIKGYLPVSTPFNFFYPGEDLPEDIVNAYWGSKEEAIKKAPIALLNSAKKEMLDTFPDMMMIEAKGDFQVIKMTNDDFLASWEKRQQGKRPVQRLIVNIHNHLSIIAAPASGEGEEWAEAVTGWMRERL